jgi:PAS domain S-box-containing protein
VAWKAGLRWQATAAAAAALVVTGVVLALALLAGAGARSDSRELSQRLVPAAASSGALLKGYTAQQSSLRDYVSSGQPVRLAPFRAAAGQEPRTRARLAGLVRRYPAMRRQLAAVLSAQRAWLANVAGPQLAAAANGNFGRAQAMQADIPRARRYVLPLRSRLAALQAQITRRQQVVTGLLTEAQQRLFLSLITMCALVAIIAAGYVWVVRRWLLRPFAALRRAAEAVAAGHYRSPVPVEGPAEFAALARSTERMRTQLLTAVVERERAVTGFRSLCDSAPDAAVAVNSAGVITRANAQADKMFGYPPGQLAGQPVDLLVPPAARAAHSGHREGYFADLRPRPMGAGLDLSAVRRDGSEFPVEISLSGVPGERGAMVTATIRDISQRLATQAEHERLLAETEQRRAQQRMQQAQRMESLGQLVGGVAHDFNNLLNVITGYTELATSELRPLAKDDPRVETVLADVGEAGEAAHKAARLTRQLLVFARRDVAKPEVLDLNDAVHGAGNLLRRTLGERIELRLTTADGLWPVKADRGQLEQVLVNFAVNARDAMPGGGTLTIESGNTRVDDTYAATHPGLHPGRYVKLRVSDTGTGMDQATIDRVFEPFFTTKPKGHGTGLGLSTVYGIVTGAGGILQIYSEPGLGTAISALLPAASEAPAAPAPATGSPDGQRGHGETILLVEDEESLRDLAQRILARNGYQVRPALLGPAAVEYAADPAHRIDLLLTDVVMPGMLGTEVASAIHQHRPRLPVVYMSGYAQPILDAHESATHHLDLLEKPFTQATLLARVHHTLHPASTAD